jgi:hypothetical protein
MSEPFAEFRSALLAAVLMVSPLCYLSLSVESAMDDEIWLDNELRFMTWSRLLLGQGTIRDVQCICSDSDDGSVEGKPLHV